MIADSEESTILPFHHVHQLLVLPPYELSTSQTVFISPQWYAMPWGF